MAGLPSSIARRALMNLVASTPPGFIGSFEGVAVTSNVLPTAMAWMAETTPLLRPPPLEERKFRRHVPPGPVGARPAPLRPVQHWPALQPGTEPKALGGTLLPVASERSFGCVSGAEPKLLSATFTNFAFALVNAVLSAARLALPDGSCQLASLISTTTGTEPERKSTPPNAPGVAGVWAASAGVPLFAAPVSAKYIAPT